MNRSALILRYILFCIFFTVGGGAVTLSILIEPELTTYFQNRQMLEEIRQQNEKIIDLTAQYRAEIDLIRSEPNVLRRLEQVTFGRTFTTDPQAASAPSAERQALRQEAKAILADLEDDSPHQTQLPRWFERCREPNTRTALFAAGAGLILITFLFFGSPGKADEPAGES